MQNPDLLLQEFDLEIRDKKGTENVVADHLSRLENIDMDALAEDSIKEEFLDEYLFSVKFNFTLWYADLQTF